MALTAKAGALVQSIGSFTDIAWGVAGGSGTSTVVTVPNLAVVKAALVSSATSATGAYCDTVSGNTFTVTTANNDLFVWIAFGIARV
jgi:hypothetical protein